MNSYYVYGLGIHSELPLPELIDVEAAGDVTIRFDPDLGHNLPSGDQTRWLELSREQATLYVDQVGVFNVINGREVTMAHFPDVRESLLRLCILGPVMGVVLYQRGNLVLHASVLDLEGDAVAFMGGSGWGKSSLAAALLRRGHELISDDVAAIDLRDDSATLLPGLSRLKLNPQVATSLDIDHTELFTLDQQNGKKDWRVPHQFPIEPIQLKRIYVLDVNTVAHIVPISHQEAVIELVRHSYPTRVNYPGDGAHLKQCAQLVERVPMVRLHRTEDIAALPQLAEMVEYDLMKKSRSKAQ